MEAAAARLCHIATTEHPYELSLSPGFSGYDPAAPQPVESLLDAADQQMYAHKRAKRLARA